MEYKCIEDIFKDRENYEKRKEEFLITIYESIENKKNSKKQAKKYWKSLINDYKNIVNEIDEQIKKVDEKIDYLATFPTDILMNFLVSCINEIEKEKYLYKKLYIKFTFNINAYHQEKSNFIFHDVIFPNELLEQVNKIEKNALLIHNYNIYKELFIEQQVRHFINPSKENINVFMLNENLFKNFPYIEDILYNIVNRRINEPNKPIHKILNDELNNLIDNNPKKLLVNKGNN